MSKTQAQLIQRTLEELDAIALGQSVPADESVQMGYAYDSLLEYLETENLAWWSANAIPDGVFWPLSKIFAEWVRETYGREDYNAGGSMNVLRKMAAKKTTRQPVRALYY